MELAAVLHDPVTTTDELIPSGETSSYRPTPCVWRSSPSPAGCRVCAGPRPWRSREAERLEGASPRPPLLDKVGDAMPAG